MNGQKQTHASQALHLLNHKFASPSTTTTSPKDHLFIQFWAVLEGPTIVSLSVTRLTLEGGQERPILLWGWQGLPVWAWGDDENLQKMLHCHCYMRFDLPHCVRISMHNYKWRAKLAHTKLVFQWGNAKLPTCKLRTSSQAQQTNIKCRLMLHDIEHGMKNIIIN